MVHDAHCHFFSPYFFQTLAREVPDVGGDAPEVVQTLAARLEWTAPESAEDLSATWVAALDAADVTRAMLIGSVPGDEESVAVAVRHAPDRFVGAFMLDPTQAGSAARVERAVGTLGLRCLCLFPAMHRYRLDDSDVETALVAADRHPGTAVFVHCGALSVGVRAKLGLPSRFDLTLGDPLAVHALAHAHPGLTFLIPHFGAGLFREALMAASLSPNVFLDTSSSNGWVKYCPGLSLAEVFRQTLHAVGAERMLFGTDSSFFPRGWNRTVWETQTAALEAAGADAATCDQVFRGTFESIFPLSLSA